MYEERRPAGATCIDLTTGASRPIRRFVSSSMSSTLHPTINSTITINPTTIITTVPSIDTSALAEDTATPSLDILSIVKRLGPDIEISRVSLVLRFDYPRWSNDDCQYCSVSILLDIFLSSLQIGRAFYGGWASTGSRNSSSINVTGILPGCQAYYSNSQLRWTSTGPLVIFRLL